LGVRRGVIYLSHKNDELLIWRIFSMKSIALAAAISLAASTAFAGSLAQPVVEPAVEAPAPAGSSAGSSGGGIVVPLLVLLAIGGIVAVASN